MLPDKANLYQKVIGSLEYLEDCSHQNLSFVVEKLGAEIAHESVRHWRISKIFLDNFPRQEITVSSFVNRPTDGDNSFDQNETHREELGFRLG